MRRAPIGHIDTSMPGSTGSLVPPENTSLSNIFRVDLNFSRYVSKKVIFRASIHRSHIYHFIHPVFTNGSGTLKGNHSN